MTVRAMMIGICALFLAAAAPAGQALPGLTILTGETWIFHIENGQPAGARRASPDSEPASGEIKVSLLRERGVTMIVTNKTEEHYAYRAFISVKPNHKGNRAEICSLMPGSVTVETWPEGFPAIRLADFTETPDPNEPC
ncbi:MAG: hypothetical protein ACAH11_14875 [Sphingomonas sp.]